MKEKVLIFDASSLISLSMNGLLNILEELKKQFKGEFIITEQVKYEVIDRPINIKRFELGAIKIQDLLDKNVLEHVSSLKIPSKQLKKISDKIMNTTNKAYYARDDYMNIIHHGEAASLALSLILSESGIDNALVVDERTTRVISENPENLRKLFEAKLHSKVQLRKKVDFLKNIKFIRSAELVYLAYKKKLVKLGNHNLLDALLYAVKYKGCSISREEIEQIKRLK